MQKNKFDYTIIGIVSSMIIFGLLILASAASVVEKISFFEQIYLGIIPGLVLAFIFLKTPLHIIKKVAPFLFLINLALIVVILISGLSYAAGGSTRWFSFGPISFQPSEFLKLTFILYVASWLASKDFKKDKEQMKTILFPFIILCSALGLIFYNQPDLSTFLVIISIGIILYFTAGAPFSHIFSTVSAGGLIALFFLWRFPYILNRITGAMSPEMGLSDVNYQARQSLITIGSGGLSGVGLGMSEQKFGNLPEQATDFIFSILAEETGFLGAFLIVLLFLGFLFRAIFLAMKTDDKFSRFILIGIGSWIFIQSSVNIGVAVNIFPVTGIPLPFISYGKSHLVAELAAIGLMLNATQYVKKKKEKQIKIVFTTGGTGGHIFPLVAIIRELKNILPKEVDFVFYYIGPKNKLSEEYIKKEGVVMKNIFAGKLRRYNDPLSILKNIIDIFIKTPIGIVQSFFYLYFISPDIIFSKGGYGSVPVILSTFFLRTPVFFHESDAVPGKANQFLQRFACEIFTSFPDTIGIPRNKIINVGNPIRTEVIGGSKEEAKKIFKLNEEKPVILIMGGSQGSERVNEIFISIANELLKDFQVIHQCGDFNYKQALAEADALIDKGLRSNYHLFSFLNEEQLRNAYKVSDLVVSRAGSGNIFEISANAKASILLPLAGSAQDHQVKNAYSYARTGATIVFEEGNFTPRFFLGKVRELFYPIEQIRIMEENAKKFARPQSAYVTASYIKEYLIEN